MSTETVYWLALGVGLGLLTLSLVLGDVFDFLDVEIGGSDFSAAPVFFATMAAFGAGGLIGLKGFGFDTGGSLLLGLGTGLSMGALTGGMFWMLRKQEASDGFELAKLTGERGRCSVAIGPGRVGRVTVSYGGMTRSLPARSDDEVAVGEEIVVRDVIGSTLTVSRAGAAQPE